MKITSEVTKRNHIEQYTAYTKYENIYDKHDFSILSENKSKTNEKTKHLKTKKN